MAEECPRLGAGVDPAAANGIISPGAAEREAERDTMHIRVSHETCVRVQVVFNAIPAAEEFLAEIIQRDDVFLAKVSAAMVFFYTFDERLARGLSMDFERRWLERLIAAKSSTPIETVVVSVPNQNDDPSGQKSEAKPVKKSRRGKSAEDPEAK